MAQAKRALPVILFCAVVLALAALCGRVLVRKSLYGAWDMTNKIAGFYNEPEDEFEVMFFGSSHAYAAFSPLELWHETGVKSYVFATQQQPMWATYHYIREAFKTQSPSVVVLEVQMMLQTEEYADAAVIHSYLDDLPFSLNKLALISASASGTDRLEYLFPLIPYHERWSELDSLDFTFRRADAHDPYRGYVLLPATGFVPEVYGMPEQAADIQEKSWTYLRRIAALCEGNGAALWLIETPSNPEPELQAVFLGLDELLAAEGLRADNFSNSSEALGLDLTTDFYDQHHLNAVGAIRFTDVFAALLVERYPDLATEPDDARWAADWTRYMENASAAMG